MDWFVYDVDLRHEKVNLITLNILFLNSHKNTLEKVNNTFLNYFENDAHLKYIFERF